MVVKQELHKLGLHYVNVNLGTVEILENITETQKQQLGRNLKVFRLDLLDKKRNIIIEKIKAVIIETIHYSEGISHVNYSNYISEKLGYDYTFSDNTFSEVKGITNQQYIILNKIERVKGLLMSDKR